ncbi:MAG TPA: rhodanese-like domain-containing protein [Longimicrobiales bacterium]|nr:rhodanese-like domain-containing protein [Longimicrobiales bacterium]
MRPGSFLAGAGLTFAALAALAGPGPDGGPGGPGPDELGPDLVSGAALLDPLDLATLIRDRRAVRVVDVRDSSAFIRFSIPTATHATLAELAVLRPGETGEAIVVYDDGRGDALRAWLLLRRLGHHDVRVLRDGVAGWLDHVLTPVLPAGSREERARFDRVADLSRYFGGMPRVGEPQRKPASTTDRAEAAITLLSRRGCY